MVVIEFTILVEFRTIGSRFFEFQFEVVNVRVLGYVLLATGV